MIFFGRNEKLGRTDPRSVLENTAGWLAGMVWYDLQAISTDFCEYGPAKYKLFS